MENPKTLLEKIDASANLVAQMMLAHKMRDEKHFMEVYNKASILLNEATTMADELEA